MKHLMKAAFAAAIFIMPFAQTDVLAQGSCSITVSNEAPGHIYDAYQIFAGNESGGILSDIEWGEGISGESLLAYLNQDEDLSVIFAGCETAEDVSICLDGIMNDSATARKFASAADQYLLNYSGTTENASGYVISSLDPGYYLVKDRDGSQTGTNDAYTRVILKTIGNETIQVKTGTVEAEKKVHENVKYPHSDTTLVTLPEGYNDVADYSIGEVIGYTLTGTLPVNYDDYTFYRCHFTDTFSAGLTADPSSVRVMCGQKDITSMFTVGYVNNVLTVNCEDLKADAEITASSKITVFYNAVLNENAVIGLDGNPNTMYLEYSNNPNAGEDTLGRTAEDRTIVFTYGIDIVKIAAQDKTDETVTLADAEFELLKGNQFAVAENGKFVRWTDSEAEATKLVTDANGVVSLSGLDDGTYALREVKAPAGYNRIREDLELIIAADTENGQNWAFEPSEALTVIDTEIDGIPCDTDVNTGMSRIMIANSQGAVLPSTGGEGTGRLYLAGSVMIVLAGLWGLKERFS
ncbi:MAG: isopeptide-forming domain-containing fimbrial protein [Solobacterium sp.]|nr:isopeptide-forming domain-containing fimbrial protein [Solobacterium sp.]